MTTYRGERLRRDPAFPALKDAIIALTGLGYWRDKEEMLADLLAGLAELRGDTVASLVRRLQAEAGHGPASEAVSDAVTVGETSFFRYRAQFEALERVVIPEVLARNAQNRSLSLWSAGCSNGAETYSLSMLLRRRFGAPLDGWRVDILGTDISVAALADARAGEYGPWTIRDLPADLRRECFCVQGRHLRVKPAFRQGVRFARHNLVTQAAPGHQFDVVLCRNVLMYFDPETRLRVLATVRDSMAPDGWLLVGHAEAGPFMEDSFVPMQLPDCTLYRKSEPPAVPLPLPPPPAARPPLPDGDPGGQVRAYLDQGEFSLAVAVSRKWAAACPLDPAPHYFLGLALEPLSEDQSIAAFRRALFLSPHLTLAHFNLMRLFLRQGDLGAARRHYVAVMADLAALPDHQRVPLGANLTVGDLVQVARRLGLGP